VVPQGGNTGLSGGAVPDASGRELVLALDRMTTIRDIDPVGLTVTAEAGAILQTVRDAAATHGRDLPISLAPQGSVTIGGLVATNAGGLDVLRHGMTRDLTLGLEVVLPDGTVVDGLRALRKDNAGYDWKQLFIGSEGTLGVVTAAVLRLVPRPRHETTALLGVASVEDSLRLFARAQDAIGDALSGFELVGRSAMELVARHSGLEPPIRASAWYLLVQARSALPGLREAALALLENAFNDGIAIDGVVAESSDQATRLWALRERVTESEAAEGPSVKHDVSLPLRAFPAFLAEAEEALASASPGARSVVFGHLGDGNIHYNVLLGRGDEPRHAEILNRTIHDLVVRHGGSISAEHGLGQYRVAEWRRLASAAEVALCARIKSCLDPEFRLNPGKVLPQPERD
jgi:FAD/FMN-containing dehydrogenase